LYVVHVLHIHNYTFLLNFLIYTATINTSQVKENVDMDLCSLIMPQYVGKWSF